MALFDVLPEGTASLARSSLAVLRNPSIMTPMSTMEREKIDIITDMEMFVSRHDLAADIAGQSMTVWAGHLVALDRAQVDIFAAVSTDIMEHIKLPYTRVLYKC